MSIKEQQEQDAAKESGHRRQKRQTSQIRGKIHGRDQKRPHGCRHHDTGRKAQKAFFHILPDPIPHKIYARSPKRRPRKRDQDPKNNISDIFHRYLSPLIREGRPDPGTALAIFLL